MTEANWLNARDPIRMLFWLERKPIGPGDTPNCPITVSERKLRLFAAACYWNVAVQADACSCGGTSAAQEAEKWAELGIPPVTHPMVRNDALENFGDPWEHARGAAQWSSYHRGELTILSHFAALAELLRDIVGNPWQAHRWPRRKCPRCGGKPRGVRSPKGGWVTCPSCQGKLTVAYCPWATLTAENLAHAAYEERLLPLQRGAPLVMETQPKYRLRRARCGEQRSATFLASDGDKMLVEPAGAPGTTATWALGGGEDTMDTMDTMDTDRLAILADAVEDAGCDDELILTHLRGPGPHVRGCWALDLILGKS